ncbi:MAG TPA: copper resistance protein CopC [Ktedonobacterales bacterium]|jgi:methionine-rich copper-binding protein CopC|nr:copper resistance protein CopC [Ktedonobacterales bacterium]
MLRSTFVSRWPVARLVGLGMLPPMLTLGILFATSGIASAHAAYVSSNPAANAVLQQVPSTVTITFAENLTPSSSNIIVYDSSMKQVSTGQAQVDNSNLKKMSVPIKGNDADVYVVVWHNVSADDGDPDAGSFSFFIGSDKAPTSSTPAAASSSGTPVWVTILVGVLGLIVGGAGTAFVLRRNAAAK